jgi:Arc/MetJ-type ribon-helix-helix transcriptional regulator
MSKERRTQSRTLDDAQASRPTTSALGKNTADLKTSVPDSVDDDIDALVRERGYPSKSDFLRELILIGLYGSDFVLNLHAERIHALARNLDARVPAAGRR